VSVRRKVWRRDRLGERIPGSRRRDRLSERAAGGLAPLEL